MLRGVLVMLGAVAVLDGCAMLGAWKSIPPPGGCDQCHAVPISANWQITYQAATIADERGRLAFQTPEYNRTLHNKPNSPADMKKVEELQCFECHNAPTPAHRERRGSFHH